MRHRMVQDAKLPFPAPVDSIGAMTLIAPLDYETPAEARSMRFRIDPLVSAIAVLCLAVVGGIFVVLTLTLLEPRFGGESKLGNAQSDLSSLEGALSQFEVDVGRFPSTGEGLQALQIAPPGIVNWHGPYVMHPPKDPWGNMYDYRYSAQTGVEIRCAGPDGKLGTPDDIVDAFDPPKST